MRRPAGARASLIASICAKFCPLNYALGDPRRCVRSTSCRVLHKRQSSPPGPPLRHAAVPTASFNGLARPGRRHSVRRCGVALGPRTLGNPSVEMQKARVTPFRMRGRDSLKYRGGSLEGP
jgi:hypothetical protein